MLTLTCGSVHYLSLKAAFFTAKLKKKYPPPPPPTKVNVKSYVTLESVFIFSQSRQSGKLT